MTTAKQARNAVKARLNDDSISIPMIWQNEQPNVELPDEPTAFAFIVFDNEGPELGPASFGDGMNANRWRNRARVEAFVFVPQGTGADAASDYAQAICDRLGAYRDEYISCFGTAVREATSGQGPAGFANEAGNYWMAIAEIDLHFDDIY